MNPKSTFTMLAISSVSYIYWVLQYIETKRPHSARFVDVKFTNYFTFTLNRITEAHHSYKNNRTILNKSILIKNCPRWPWYVQAKKELDSCPAKCTLQRSSKNLTSFEAVIFYAASYADIFLPARSPGQIWVYFNMEPPPYSSDFTFVTKKWKNMINWTMTYRHDSDIHYPYGSIVKREKRENLVFPLTTLNKSKPVAWLVSHCSTPSRRFSYVQQLRKTISVDIFGTCGNLTCVGKERNDCIRWISRQYKFYLSFENTLCHDYVSEKLFDFMRENIVPVVRGGAKYSKILPPKSHINTADFKSPNELGEYLLYLDKNNTAYVEYFKWKNHYTFGRQSVGACELCKRLFDVEKHAKTYENVYRWWHENTCHTPKKFS